MIADAACGSAPSEVQAQIHYRLIERLSASERRYRALVEQLREPVLQCDGKGRLEYVNAAWSELTGHDRESSLGRSLLEFADPEHVTALARALAIAGSIDEGPAVTGECRFRTASGRFAHVGFSMGQGSDDTIVASLHDLSVQKETEKSLERARDVAEQASRLKSTFLANMSHEIRTPLSAVLGYAELLSNPELDTPERRDYADRAERNGSHLLTLVSDILDFSRIESGKLEVSPEPFVLCELVDDLQRQYMPEAEKRGLSLKTSWRGTYPEGEHLVSDRTRLRQVLTNLLSNALKFTAGGGVTLEIESDPEARRIRFAVTDTGIGIDSANADSLFEPWRQADETITRRFGGTGLGLAISARLATLLGGTLSAEGNEGQGSRFVLDLPLRSSRLPAAEPRSEQHSPEVGCSVGGRVLVVEDTNDLRNLMTRFCEDIGLEAHSASNGDEAVDRVGRAGSPFRAILMDMQMPVMDGYSATRELRAGGYDGLIVAMTAYAMRGDREKCLAAGCDDYLAKPVTKSSLRGLFEKHGEAGA